MYLFPGTGPLACMLRYFWPIQKASNILCSIQMFALPSTLLMLFMLRTRSSHQSISARPQLAVPDTDRSH